MNCKLFLAPSEAANPKVAPRAAVPALTPAPPRSFVNLLLLIAFSDFSSPCQVEAVRSSPNNPYERPAIGLVGNVYKSKFEPYNLAEPIHASKVVYFVHFMLLLIFHFINLSFCHYLKDIKIIKIQTETFI